MGVLLDTNTVIFFTKGHPQVVARWERQRPQDLHLSTLTVHELLVGAESAERPEPRRSIVTVLSRTLPVLDFTAADAACSARIQAQLSAQGQRIGTVDVLLAGTALARGLTIVTNNTREFSRVPGLRVEDWTTLP